MIPLGPSTSTTAPCTTNPTSRTAGPRRAAGAASTGRRASRSSSGPSASPGPTESLFAMQSSFLPTLCISTALGFVIYDNLRGYFHWGLLNVEEVSRFMNITLYHTIPNQKMPNIRILHPVESLPIVCMLNHYSSSDPTSKASTPS